MLMSTDTAPAKVAQTRMNGVGWSWNLFATRSAERPRTTKADMICVARSAMSQIFPMMCECEVGGWSLVGRLALYPMRWNEMEGWLIVGDFYGREYVCLYVVSQDQFFRI
jgi:hypothetical protein